LVENKKKLERKIRVVSLYDCIFEQNTSQNSQSITFDEIARITQLGSL